MAMILSDTRKPSVAGVSYNRGYVYRTSTITALGGLLFGYDLVIISGTVPFFTQQFNLNEFQTGWAVGCINLGCVLGSLLAGKLSDVLGRKKLLFICAFLFALTGVCTGWAATFSLFIFFRILSGVAVGAAALVCPMYTAEISPAPLRGRMVSFYQLAITTGILLAYLSNYFLLNTGSDNWRWMFTSQSLPALLFMAGLFTVPESPRWLIRKKRNAEAKKVLTAIGGEMYAQAEGEAIRQSFSKEVKEQVKNLFSKEMAPVLFIGIMIAVFSQAGGQNSLFSYAPVLFKQAGMAEDSAFLQSIIIGVINFLFTFIAIGTIDKTGRKKLLQYGSLLLFFNALAIGAAFYFNWPGAWVLIFVLSFIATYSATLGPVTWVALSEIFPNRIRGNAMAAATLALWLANFFATASFPVMKTHLGLPATFAIHGFVCLAYFFFVRIRVPETKGRSLEEIETQLTGKYHN